VDNDGQTLPERHVGNILVKSPSTTQGYYQRDDLNKDLFHNGYLKTGDLGYISNKEIFVTGRKKDLIIVNGININAEEIEAYAIRMKEVKPGRLAAFALKDSKTDSEKIHLVIETRREYQYLLPRKRKQLQKKVSDTISNFFPIKEEQVSIVPPGSIKKTTSGKVQRSKMKQLFLNGKLKSENFILNFFLGQMRENQIKLKVFITGLKPRNFKGA
jgi:acyl-CoA synthetase (AMP-forming)/AMP-acid ligase II